MVKVKSFPICRPSKPFIVSHNFNCSEIQKIYQMGREIEQTKEHLPAKIRLSFSLTLVLGWGMTALCHSHFDLKGGCKVFVLRNEIKHHLTKVNVTDGQQKKNVSLNVSELNKSITLKEIFRSGKECRFGCK